MPRFRVLCFEAGAAGDCTEHHVEAKDEREAAERVCGGPFADHERKPGQLRAQVAPVGKPNAMKLFYVRD